MKTTRGEDKIDLLPAKRRNDETNLTDPKATARQKRLTIGRLGGNVQNTAGSERKKKSIAKGRAGKNLDPSETEQATMLPRCHRTDNRHTGKKYHFVGQHSRERRSASLNSLGGRKKE